MDELVTKGEVRAALLALDLDPVTWSKIKLAIGRIPPHDSITLSVKCKRRIDEWSSDGRQKIWTFNEL